MNYKEELAHHRSEINRINEEIMEKISERVQVALKIGELKNKYNRPVVDKAREEEIMQQVKILAMEKSLLPCGAERVFREIIKLCVEAEKKT